MRIFAIGDPHLSLSTPEKSMEPFGPKWHRHAERLAENWRAAIGEDDLVLVPGDISWALKLDRATTDLEYLGELPGTKVISKGNHDYWWSSNAKVRAALPARMHAVQGEAVRVGRVVVGGTRLWDVPGVDFDGLIDCRPNPLNPDAENSRERSEEQVARDLALYEREVGRLKLALEAIEAEAAEGDLRVVMVHYPPCSATLEPNELTALFEAHRIDHVVFGHLHSLYDPLPAVPFGERTGVRYHLTSLDYLDCQPAEIASAPAATPGGTPAAAE